MGGHGLRRYVSKEPRGNKLRYGDYCMNLLNQIRKGYFVSIPSYIFSRKSSFYNTFRAWTQPSERFPATRTPSPPKASIPNSASASNRTTNLKDPAHIPRSRWIATGSPPPRQRRPSRPFFRDNNPTPPPSLKTTIPVQQQAEPSRVESSRPRRPEKQACSTLVPQSRNTAHTAPINDLVTTCSANHLPRP